MGFVSNSSTTSFSIIGIELKEGDVAKIEKALSGTEEYKEVLKTHEEYNSKWKVTECDEGYEWDILEAIHLLLPKPLSVEFGECYNDEYGETDGVYIGADYCAMKLTETKHEFFCRITESLEKIGLSGPISLHSEAWRDG